jgi:very-short-patch-repair endonuclease
MRVRRHHVTDESREHARQLRREMTPAEKKLWLRLRAGEMFGVKFRRQHPVEPYIVDFCCPPCRLIIEIDGDTHADAAARDAARTERIEELDYRVIRFTNKDVHENLDGVLDTILHAVMPTSPSP